jgi:hypothetical protein
VVFVIKVERIIDEHGQIVRETQREIPAYFDDAEGYLLWPRKNHGKHYRDTPFPAGMSFMDIGRMTVLSESMWSNTNMLGVKGQGGVKPFDLTDIAKVLKVAERQSYRFVDRMLKLGVMAKVKVMGNGESEIQYYINPLYFFGGKRLPLSLYLLFRKQLDAVLPTWVIQRFGKVKEIAQQRWGMRKE